MSATQCTILKANACVLVSNVCEVVLNVQFVRSTNAVTETPSIVLCCIPIEWCEEAIDIASIGLRLPPSLHSLIQYSQDCCWAMSITTTNFSER